MQEIDKSWIYFVIGHGKSLWQPILVANWRFIVYRPLFVALPFRNGLEYWNADKHARSALNLPTSCGNLVGLAK